jgi:hypothetical protein
MAEAKRVEIGFGGGQVLSVRLAEQAIEDLKRRALADATGWQELETADGRVALDVRQVVFVRVEDGEHRIGFVGA